jgi:hypothetical protein
MTDDPQKYSEKDQWDDDLDVAPLNYVRPKVQKPILEKAEFDQKKKPLWIPILSIALLLVIGSIFLFIYRGSIFNTQKEKLSQKTIISADSSQYKPNKKDKEQELQIIEDDPSLNEYVADSMMIESAENEMSDETAPTGSEPDLIEGPKNFHIVIGSFEQERNAYSFASNRESLSEDLTVTEHKGWYRVSHSTYADNTEAEIALDNLRNSLNILAWIAYMK